MTGYRPKAKTPPPIHGNQPPVLPLSVTPPQAAAPRAAINRTMPTPASMIEFDLFIVMALAFCLCSPSRFTFSSAAISETVSDEVLYQRGQGLVQSPGRAAW